LCENLHFSWHDLVGAKDICIAASCFQNRPAIFWLRPPNDLYLSIARAGKYASLCVPSALSRSSESMTSRHTATDKAIFKLLMRDLKQGEPGRKISTNRGGFTTSYPKFACGKPLARKQRSTSLPRGYSVGPGPQDPGGSLAWRPESDPAEGRLHDTWVSARSTRIREHTSDPVLVLIESRRRCTRLFRRDPSIGKAMTHCLRMYRKATSSGVGPRGDTNWHSLGRSEYAYCTYDNR